MRKRNSAILVRLYRDEMEQLEKKARRCGLSKEGYIRMYISGYNPKETPPADYRDMMNELYAISRNMNQIAHIANSGKHIESEKYWRELKKLEKAIVKINNAVLNPEET